MLIRVKIGNMLALVDLICCPFFRKNIRGNIMKKLLVVSAIAALSLTSVAFAGGLPEEMPTAPAAGSSDTGIYLGLQAGFGLTNWKNLAFGSITANKDSGFVGRVFTGYDINRYFAVETGYSRFFNVAKLALANVARVEYKTQAIDAYFKGKLPVVEGFDLYAKLGAGYLMSKQSAVAADSTNQKNNNVNVAFGAGADYYVTPNVIANIEWTRIEGYEKSSDNKYIPHVDAFVIGLRYKFDV